MRFERAFNRCRPPLIGVVALWLLALAVPAAVLAHAELETVTPADGATVAELTEIVMTFSQDLDPAKSSIVLVDGAGSTVLSGGDVRSSDPTRMTLAVADLPAGTYEIRWTSASSADGDLERGTTTFTYAPPNPTESDLLPTPTPSASPTPSPSPSAVPSPSPSAAPSPSTSGSGTPAASTSDVLIPIVVAVVVIAALGAWLLRGRSHGGGPA